jgi:hypothetical protein
MVCIFQTAEAFASLKNEALVKNSPANNKAIKRRLEGVLLFLILSIIYESNYFR